IGTLFGIIPGTLAYSVAGAGLGSVVEAQNATYNECLANNAESACTYSIDTSSLVTKELVAAFVLLGIVALIPVFLNKWKNRNVA
nr:TVP38/TMEM64 family protein [Alphaproteobacteria bacterium]